MSDFFIKYGDTLPVLSMVFRDEDGVVIDNSTVDSCELHFREARNNGDLLTRDAVDTGSGGEYTYTFVPASDFIDGQFEPGRYKLEAVLTIGSDTLTIPSRSPRIIEVTRPV